MYTIDKCIDFSFLLTLQLFIDLSAMSLAKKCAAIFGSRGKFFYKYSVAQKIGTILYALTSSNIDQFSNLFHC